MAGRLHMKLNVQVTGTYLACYGYVTRRIASK